MGKKRTPAKRPRKKPVRKARPRKKPRPRAVFGFSEPCVIKDFKIDHLIQGEY